MAGHIARSLGAGVLVLASVPIAVVLLVGRQRRGHTLRVAFSTRAPPAGWGCSRCVLARQHAWHTTPLLSIKESGDEDGTPSQFIDDGSALRRDQGSKTEMLKFALPALGIYICDPLMGNIDNAFVGHFSGTVALASLGPGSVLANNLIFLFASILNSATTGLVARAWAENKGDPSRARVELRRTLSCALLVGLCLSIFYIIATPWALQKLGTPVKVLGPAASYARIRGVVAWAVLAQGVCLSAILATRDSITPLRVVMVATALNFAGDWLLCCWPLQTGVVGAASATSLSVVAGCGLMLGSLRSKGLLSWPCVPRRQDLAPVFEYAGPLLVITTARVLGFTAMAVSAVALGTAQLAAYQVVIGVFVVFAFVGAPLTQNAQTVLPALLDRGDTRGTRRALGNIFILAVSAAFVVATLCCLTLRFGAGFFTSDTAVLREVAGASLPMFLATFLLLVSSSVDGSLLAAKDFGFIVPTQVAVCALQICLLGVVRRLGLGLPFVFLTFSVRLLSFLAAAFTRVSLGKGPLGRTVRGVYS